MKKLLYFSIILVLIFIYGCTEVKEPSILYQVNEDYFGVNLDTVNEFYFLSDSKTSYLIMDLEKPTPYTYLYSGIYNKGETKTVYNEQDGKYLGYYKYSGYKNPNLMDIYGHYYSFITCNYSNFERYPDKLGESYSTLRFNIYINNEYYDRVLVEIFKSQEEIKKDCVVKLHYKFTINGNEYLYGKYYVFKSIYLETDEINLINTELNLPIKLGPYHHTVNYQIEYNHEEYLTGTIFLKNVTYTLSNFLNINYQEDNMLITKIDIKVNEEEILGLNNQSAWDEVDEKFKSLGYEIIRDGLYLSNNVIVEAKFYNNRLLSLSIRLPYAVDYCLYF